MFPTALSRREINIRRGVVREGEGSIPLGWAAISFFPAARMLVIRSLCPEISIVVASSSHNVRTKEGVPGTVPSCLGAYLPQQEHCSLGHVVRAMRAAQNTHVTHSLHGVIARIQGE